MFARFVDIGGLLLAVGLAVLALHFGVGAGDGLPLAVGARAAQGFASIAAVLVAAGLCFAGAIRYTRWWDKEYETRAAHRRALGLRVFGAVLLVLGAAVLAGVRAMY